MRETGRALSFLPAIEGEARLRFLELFLRQFSGDPLELMIYFQTLKFARQALHALCWPDPSPRQWAAWFGGGVTLHHLPTLDRAARGPLARFFKAQSQNDRADRLRFRDLADACRWLSELLETMRAAAPIEAAPRPQRAWCVPDRRAMLEPHWARSPRVANLSMIADRFTVDLPAPVTPILFGSLAEEGPWPEYADCDMAFAFDATDAATLEQAVLAFRRVIPLILRIDPLQHHGPFIFLPGDAEFFSEAYLPLDTFALATTLNGTAIEKTVTTIEARLHALEALTSATRAIEHFLWHHYPPRDRFTTKYLVSLVLLVPALYCAATGRPIEKSASFDLLKADLEEGAVATLECYERFRREWHWSLQPPARLLDAFGARAGFLARNANRWPSPAMAGALGGMAERTRALLRAIFEALERRL